MSMDVKTFFFRKLIACTMYMIAKSEKQLCCDITVSS